MTSDDDSILDSRVTRLEQQLAEITDRLDRLSAERSRRPAAPETSGVRRKSAPSVSIAPAIGAKSVEWWLSRGGAVLTCFALILLYQYAVDQNWITPVVRLVTGTVVGGLLMVWAARIPRGRPDAPEDSLGMRELLMGAALSAWYITAYAGAVFYQLIPMGQARLIYLVLSVAGGWLALRERRALLAVLALGVGFATPALLSAPSIPPFAAHLAALTAVGLVLFLVRGWQSVLWLTFAGSWLSVRDATVARWPEARFGISGAAGDEISMTLLIVACTLAFVRVPILRRRLLAVGSERYTEPRRSLLAQSVLRDIARLIAYATGGSAAFDSAALWGITIASPLLALESLSWIWPSAPSAVWGTAALIAAAIAYRFAASPDRLIEEFTHVAAAATALWSLAGVVWITSTMADIAAVSIFAACLAAAALHAFAISTSAKASGFVVARRIALSTTVVVTAMVVATEATGIRRGIAPFITFAELVVIGVATRTWWRLHNLPDQRVQRRAAVIGVLAYLAAMLVDARVLAAVWPPLVTASYAIAGTALLLLSAQRERSSSSLRKLAGFTLVVVVARLLVIDLAGVETIWRVLLFLGCGGLFLFTSYRLRAPRSAPVGLRPQD